MSGVNIVSWMCQVQISTDDIKAIYVPPSVMDAVLTHMMQRVLQPLCQLGHSGTYIDSSTANEEFS